MRELSPWHIAHLVVIASWGGLALGEVVLEIAALRSQALRPAAAQIHRAIDRFVEVPLLLGILLTGGVLLSRAAPGPTLWFKVAAGVGAVGSIFATVGLVTRRARAVREGASPQETERLTRAILRVGVVAFPLLGAALALGGRRVGWW